MANPEHLAILKQGVKVWNEWRENGRGLPDFSGVNFMGVDLRGVNFHAADLKKVDLSEADLRGANLRYADFREADLFRTDFSMADLHGANLREAKLYGTILTEADLIETNLMFSRLQHAKLDRANFASAEVYNTIFGTVDLSQALGLESLRHRGPSIVGVDTLYESKGNIPEVFLRGCGVPETFITFMHSLIGKAFDFYSCFISHSSKDKRFCERLYADLQAKAVRVWYFPEDAKWGETVWGEIDRSIKVYDKLVVVLSENSLQSGPVAREIERALNREDNEGKNILFPIRIDEYIFEKWEHERQADVVRKVVGDFSGWDKDANKYDKAFDKLLKGLQAS